MDESKAITFRPGSDADLLEALAFVLRMSRNEVLREGLHALAAKYETRINDAADALAKLKEPRP